MKTIYTIHYSTKKPFTPFWGVIIVLNSKSKFLSDFVLLIERRQDLFDKISGHLQTLYCLIKNQTGQIKFGIN